MQCNICRYLALNSTLACVCGPFGSPMGVCGELRVLLSTLLSPACAAHLALYVPLVPSATPHSLRLEKYLPTQAKRALTANSTEIPTPRRFANPISSVQLFSCSVQFSCPVVPLVPGSAVRFALHWRYRLSLHPYNAYPSTYYNRVDTSIQLSGHIQGPVAQPCRLSLWTGLPHM
jgi:hypothetical protein